MPYKQTGRPSGRPKGSATVTYDLNKLEFLASLRLSLKEIAVNLGVEYGTLWAQQESRKDVSDAIERGRAKSTAMCAQVIMQAAQPLTKRQKEELQKQGKEPPEISAQNFRASMEYLNRFSDCWKPIQQQQQPVIVQNQIDVNTTAADSLPDEVKARAAWAYLLTSGQLPANTPPPDNVRQIRKSG